MGQGTKKAYKHIGWIYNKEEQGIIYILKIYVYLAYGNLGESYRQHQATVPISDDHERNQ